MMTPWPVYRISFTPDAVVEVVAPGIGTAIVDAVTVANQEAAVGNPAFWRESYPWASTDIMKIRQLGAVYVSSAVAEATAELHPLGGESAEINLIGRRGPHGGTRA